MAQADVLAGRSDRADRPEVEVGGVAMPAALRPDALVGAVVDDATQVPEGVERSSISEPESPWEPGIDLVAWLERRARLDGGGRS